MRHKRVYYDWSRWMAGRPGHLLLYPVSGKSAYCTYLQPDTACCFKKEDRSHRSEVLLAVFPLASQCGVRVYVYLYTHSMLPPCTVCLLVFALGIGTETTVSAFRFKNPHTSTTRTHIRTEHIILREQPDLSPSLDNKEQGIIPWLPFIAAYGVMPSLFIALVDPNLSAIASSDAGFIAVLLSTRVHLYAMALVALDITSRKAQFSPATLFDRFILANEDLLGKYASSTLH